MNDQRPSGFSPGFVVPVLIGPVLNPINTTMISVALVPIARDLHLASSVVIWLVAGLYLASAIAQPTMGKIGDIVGPRKVYLTGLVIVLVAGVAARARPRFRRGADRPGSDRHQRPGRPAAVGHRRAGRAGRRHGGPQPRAATAAGPGRAAAVPGRDPDRHAALELAAVAAADRRRAVRRPAGLASVSNQAALYRQAPRAQLGTAAGLSRTSVYLGAIASSEVIGLTFGQAPTDRGLHHIGWLIIVPAASAAVLALADRILARPRVDELADPAGLPVR